MVTSPSPRLVDGWLRTATDHMRAQRWNEALEEIETAIQVNPDSGSAHLGRLAVLTALQRSEEGTSSVACAMAGCNRDDIIRCFDLALPLLSELKGSLAEGLISCRVTAQRCDVLAREFGRRNLHREAAEMWALAHRIAPRMDRIYDLCRSHQSSGDFEAMEEAARTAIEINADHGWGALFLGNALEGQGRIEEAMQAWRDCQASPQDGGSHRSAQQAMERHI